LAVSHCIEHPNLLEHQEIRATARRYRTVHIKASGQIRAAADPYPTI
jgi:hypothetical protein